MIFQIGNSYTRIAQPDSDMMALVKGVCVTQDVKKTPLVFPDYSGWKFPTGLFPAVAQTLKDSDSKFYIEDLRTHVENSEREFEWNPSAVLRKYQKDAANSLLKKGRGIMELGTGGGKTITSARLIYLLKRRAFVIVINSDALDSTTESYKRYFLNADIGVWGNGKKSVGRDITIATIQSLASHKGNPNSMLFRAFMESDTIIADEIHTTGGPGLWGSLLEMSQAYHKIGQTATPFRGASEDSTYIVGVTGNVNYRRPAITLQEDAFLAASKIVFVNYCPDDIVESGDYDTDIVYNDSRNELIASLAKRHNQVTVIRVKKKIHAEVLSRLTGFPVYKSDISESEKQVIRDGLKNATIAGVVATSIITASADFPPIKIMIDADLVRSRIVLVQVNGRALRKYKEQDAIYYTLYDSWSSKYKKAAEIKAEKFREEGWKIHEE